MFYLVVKKSLNDQLQSIFIIIGKQLKIFEYLKDIKRIQ
jgi:hypothetical protein